jgi:aminoglycoside 6'-N-acetyltransferase
MNKPQSAPASVPIRYDLRGMGPGDLHPYRDQPCGTTGIDHFIGGARVIGRYGSRLIARVVEYLFNGDIPYVKADRDPTHARLAAFRRAGLRCFGQRDTAWGPGRLMRCDNLKPTVSP